MYKIRGGSFDGKHLTFYLMAIVMFAFLTLLIVKIATSTFVLENVSRSWSTTFAMICIDGKYQPL